jgi:uncharacterized protein (TIGR02757 family)
MKKNDWVKDFLDELVDRYNCTSFIETDPISIPHQFHKKEDIELSAFLTATIAWGNRKSIIKSANRMIELVENSPYDFITGHSKRDLDKMERFVYRTFNHLDFISFVSALRKIYLKHGGLEKCFSNKSGAFNSISSFRNTFIQYLPQQRTLKHISNPASKASCKRLNMFLRWMVRKDNRKVDFGIWKVLKSSELMIPLDVHTGNTARQLKILSRTQNDRQATEELTGLLRQWNTDDPVVYDFALFGAGVNKINHLPAIA